MKNNKMLLVALTGLVFGLSSQMKALTVDVEFDFVNKSSNMVHVNLSDSRGKILRDKEIVPVGGAFHISYVDQSYDSFQWLKITVQKTGEAPKVYQIKTQDKSTCYVTYGKKNGELTLYPQKGRFVGLSGKTERGYQLDKKSEKNVSAENIVEGENNYPRVP